MPMPILLLLSVMIELPMLLVPVNFAIFPVAPWPVIVPTASIRAASTAAA